MTRSKNLELKENNRCISEMPPNVCSVKLHGMKCSDYAVEKIQLGNGHGRFQNIMIMSYKSELSGFVCIVVDFIFLKTTLKEWLSRSGSLKSFVSYTG